MLISHVCMVGLRNNKVRATLALNAYTYSRHTLTVGEVDVESFALFVWSW